ncbi:TNF receptor-associated factor 3-like [Hydractinia symbiolongicarpus]|uniref:TNF receptor-associated factor 3-like n=1 Tax=Hydractinia symbiolongicarpus TaxID=13093 RepID=UPI00254D377A|nr:TNF receptor-associated factor 3-like [Hydractinia symbiolongicarpus]
MAECDGGFDANFVTDIHDLLKCVVCNFVLKSPVQVIECGHRFCRECYEKIKEYALSRDVELLCPLDRLVIDEKQVFPDKGIERRILDLQVKCDHLNDGCEWMNELRHLQNHINNECFFALVCCPNDGCNINSVRSELEDHKKICPMKESSQSQKLRKLETMISEVMERLKAKDDQLEALTMQMKENDANSRKMMSNVMERLKAKDDQLDALKMQIKENEVNSKTKISEVMERFKAKDDQLDALTMQMKENDANLKTMMSNVMERLKAKDDQLDALKMQIKENEVNSKTMISEVMERFKSKDDELNALKMQIKENEANSKTMMVDFMDKLKAKDNKLDSLVTQMKNTNIKLETVESELKILNKNFNGYKNACEDVKKDIVSLKVLQNTKLVGYFQWNITECSRKRSQKKISSSPFSTLNGYKCALLAQWSDKNEFGIFIYLKVGEIDDDLIWPFNMKVTFECCNGDDIVKRILDSSNSVGYPWRKKPSAEIGGDYGFSKFLLGSHLDKFVKDDSIVINCYIETMDTQ